LTTLPVDGTPGIVVSAIAPYDGVPSGGRAEQRFAA